MRKEPSSRSTARRETVIRGGTPRSRQKPSRARFEISGEDRGLWRVRGSSADPARSALRGNLAARRMRAEIVLRLTRETLGGEQGRGRSARPFFPAGSGCAYARASPRYVCTRMQQQQQRQQQRQRRASRRPAAAALRLPRRLAPFQMLSAPAG